MFIARISRGRTIRQFLAGVIQHGDDFVFAVERDPEAGAEDSTKSGGEPVTG